MPKLPTRRFASRMSGLRIVIACLLTLVAPTRLPADEPSTTEATRAIADSTRAAEKVEAAPRRRIEVSVQLVELDKSQIADDKSALWQLVPWTKVGERYASSSWSGFSYGPVFWNLGGQQVDSSLFHKFSDVIRGQVQAGKALMSFTIPQEDAARFVTDAVAHKQGRLVQESTNAADEGSLASFRLAHHPLSVRHATFALRPNSHISRKFSVAPRSFREGIHLAVFSEVAVTTPVKTGWPWLDKQIPPSREMVSGSARLTELVPRGQALVVFSLGSGDDDMEPGKPSLLVIVPKEIDAVAMPAAAKIGDAAAQPAQPTERLGYGRPVAPPTGVSPATPTSQLEPEAAPRRVIPAVATETQSSRPRRRDQPELKALHDDVRALHEDVRRLSELLEKRHVGSMNRELGEGATKHRLPMKASPQDSGPAELPQKDKTGDAVLTISASEKRPKPIAIQVGQRGAFQFEHRIKTVNGYDGKIIGVTRVAPKQLVVQGQSAGMTSLRLSFDESDEIVDVFVRVLPLADEVTPETKVSLSSKDLLPKPIPLRVGGSAELKFDDWLTRVDGFDPQLIAVTAIDKDRLRVRGLTAGTTSIQLTTRGGKLPIELFVKVRHPTDEEREQLPVVSTWITAATELAKPIVVSAGGERPVSCDRNVVRISIADQELIDVSQMTPKNFSVVGRKEGCSTVTVWFEGTDTPMELVVKVVPRPDAVGLDNVLLNFTASWCGPCQQMQPLVRKLERAACPIQTIDVDKSPDVAKRFHVQSIPCFIRLAEGKEIERVTGLVVEQELRRLAKRTNPILAGLEKRVSFRVENTALKDVVKKLSELSGVNIILDKRGLEEEGLTPNAVVSIVVDDITAQSALRLILEPINLDTIERDEVLLVTSRIRTKGEPTVNTYPVEDLFPLLDPAGKNTPERNDKCLKRIGEVIQSTISPDSWDAVGGQGSLRYYETTRSLIVRQTGDVHAEITRLLDQIRRLKRLPGRVSNAVGQPLIVRTYAVADLVVPIPGEPGDRATPRTSDWLKLVDHITTTVEPENWTADSGPCSIETHEKTLSLVIRATPEMHAATANLLNALRREQDVQVSVQVRWVKFDDDTELKKAGLELNFDTATRSMKLDAKAAETFIATCGKQGEFAPKLTMFNGQVGTIQTEDPIGVRLELHLRGVVTHDRRSVCLGVALNPDSLVNELVRHSNNMSDGEYLLLDMTEQSYRDKSEKPNCRMLVLVQPRIIIQKEEELLGFPKAEGAERYVPVK